MINDITSCDSDFTAEPSEQFESLVLQIDAALHAGRIPELPESSLEELCPAERSQLERTRRQLERLYSESSLNRTARQPDISSSGTKTIVGDDYSPSEFGAGSCDLINLGIHQGRFGRFEILRGLGMGGEGVVFLARDPVLDRLIALKVPRPEVLISQSLRKRFLTQGRAAALLTHPNIVSVFESGELGSVCFLAQEYVAGPSLATWLSSHPLPVSPVVAGRIILQLTEAVALAHSRQILHRDIKPANILMAPLTTAASLDDIDQFEPKLSDFGLAKLLQVADQTRTGAVLGTPAYMSPEQAAGHKEVIGPTSDIYGLGAVLRELLTHQAPYHGESAVDTLHQVLHQEPPRPRKLVTSIPLDLEAVCMKCLQREPRDRYQTAQELAEDLRRFLDGRPVVARPLSTVTTLTRWARKNPLTACLSSAVILAVFSLLVGSWWFSSRLNDALIISRRHEQNLLSRTQELRQRVYAGDLHQAAEAWQDGKAVEARQRLHACVPDPGESDFRTFPWWMLSHQIENSSRVIGTFDKGTASAAVAVSPAGDVIASGEPDGVIRLRSFHDGRLVAELRGHGPGPIHSLHFGVAADNVLLVSAGDDATVRLWDLQTRDELRTFRGHTGKVHAARFIGKDAEAIASGGQDRVIRIWDRQTGQVTGELSGHTDIVRSLAEQTDTGTLFSAAEDGTIRLWDWRHALPDLRVSEGCLPMHGPDGWARVLSISPNGTELAAGFRSGYLARWEITHGDSRFGQVNHVQRYTSGIRALGWRDNQTLAVGFGDSRILLNSDIHSAERKDEFIAGHSDWVLSVDIVPGTKDLVSASKDGTIRVWPGDQFDGQIYVASENDGTRTYPAWNNSILTVAMQDKVIGYQMPERTQILVHEISDLRPGAWTSVIGHGEKLLTTVKKSDGLFLTMIDIASGIRDWQLPLGNYFPEEGCLSPDEKRVYLCVNRELLCVDAVTGKQVWAASHPMAANDVVFLPQADLVVTICMDGMIRFWHAATGLLREERLAHQNAGQVLTVTRDGQYLASAGEDLWARVWRITDWKEIASFGLSSEINELGFLDDGRTLVAYDNIQLTFWSVSEQIEVMRWYSFPKSSRIVMNPDETTIAVQSGRNIRLFQGTR